MSSTRRDKARKTRTPGFFFVFLFSDKSVERERELLNEKESLTVGCEIVAQRLVKIDVLAGCTPRKRDAGGIEVIPISGKALVVIIELPVESSIDLIGETSDTEGSS